MQLEASVDETFTGFVRRVEPRLRQALIAVFGPDTGCDAAEEALVYAWRNWERVQAMENPAGYLYRVGQSRGRDFLRRNRVERFPALPSSHEPRVEPGLPNALRELSTRQRAAVMLVHGFGWTFAEVAELLGVSRTTVQKHVERALKKLQISLGVEDEN